MTKPAFVRSFISIAQAGRSRHRQRRPGRGQL